MPRTPSSRIEREQNNPSVLSRLGAFFRNLFGFGPKISKEDRGDIKPTYNWIITPKSTWVQAFRWFSKHIDSPGKLQVRFKDRKGWLSGVVEYKVPYNLYIGMQGAVSKGKYVWRHLYFLPYILLQGRGRAPSGRAGQHPGLSRGNRNYSYRSHWNKSSSFGFGRR